MIAVGNQNKKIKTKTNVIISIICPCNHCWGLIIIYPYYTWLKSLFGLNKKERIIEFSIGYMINPTLNIKKPFKWKVTKCMKTTFGAITQPNSSKILAKNTTRVLALLMFYKTRKILRKFSKC